jgi:hypothetical protein
MYQTHNFDEETRELGSHQPIHISWQPMYEDHPTTTLLYAAGLAFSPGYQQYGEYRFKVP